MQTALILIDIQNEYFPGGWLTLHEPERAAENAARLLEHCRNRRLPVLHIRHINDRENATYFVPGTHGADIYARVAPLPDEPVIVKHRPNGFFRTALQQQLSGNGVEHLVICGMMSHMCIDTTVRAASDLGYAVTVAQDACTTRELCMNGRVIPANTVHDAFMAALHGSFADVRNSHDIIISL